MRDHDEAIRLDPNYGAAYSNRGNVFSSLGQRDRAIQDYNEALRINPRDPKALNNRGDEYTLLGKYDLAIKDLDAAIRIEQNPVRLSNRCFARAIIGKLRDAIADCNKSLEMRPKSAVVHGRRGLAYLKLARFDEAMNDFNAALEISARQALSLYGRGLVKLHNGDTAGGNADLSEAKTARAAIADEYAKYGAPVENFVKAAAPPMPAIVTLPAPVQVAPPAPSQVAPPAPTQVAPPAPPPPRSAMRAPPAVVPVPAPTAPALAPIASPVKPAAPVQVARPAPVMAPSARSPATAAPLAQPPLPTPRPIQTSSVPTSPGGDCARAETHWKSAEDIHTLAVYEDHLARFGNCDFSTLAKIRIEQLKKK
jgi:Flp pilus assembly protein TadD